VEHRLQLLFESQHFQVSRFVGEPIALLVRTAVVFASATEVGNVFAPVERVLEQTRRECPFLLLDTRAAVGNNDASYEQSYARFRVSAVQGFRATAIVVRTRVGLLQSRRLLLSDQVGAHVTSFDDYEQALASLRQAARQP
jgi:hypothetical protein